MSTPSHPVRRGGDIARSGGNLFYPYLTPHGPITIRTSGDRITDIALGDVSFEGARKPSEAAGRAATQIQEYLAGKRRRFDLELAPLGTAFQREVWDAVAQIPYGSSLTCAEIAGNLGRPESFRAVGSAVRKNPLAIVIPTHRVVDANGKPLGTGRSADLKGALLRIERDRLAKERGGAPAPSR